MSQADSSHSNEINSDFELNLSGQMRKNTVMDCMKKVPPTRHRIGQAPTSCQPISSKHSDYLILLNVTPQRCGAS